MSSQKEPNPRGTLARLCLLLSCCAASKLTQPCTEGNGPHRWLTPGTPFAPSSPPIQSRGGAKRIAVTSNKVRLQRPKPKPPGAEVRSPTAFPHTTGAHLTSNRASHPPPPDTALGLQIVGVFERTDKESSGPFHEPIPAAPWRCLQMFVFITVFQPCPSLPRWCPTAAAKVCLFIDFSPGSGWPCVAFDLHCDTNPLPPVIAPGVHPLKLLQPSQRFTPK